MNNIILFDPESRENLLPLSYTRPVCELRVGILTIKEKWEHWLDGKASFITQAHLAGKYSMKVAEDNYVINGSVLPSSLLSRLIRDLEKNEALLKNGELIAARLSRFQFEGLMDEEAQIKELKGYELVETQFSRISFPWDIFSLNEQELAIDFELLTKGRTSAPISHTNQVIARENIFLEEGAKVECAILNASNGPIYIGKNAEIMEGSIVRGGLAMCEGSALKLGAKIYGATTIGPYSKVGGEVNNSVLIGYSNKGHDGFLGNSVIGEWCNLGADTNNSNLKNNYAEVKAWNYAKKGFIPTGLQFCGLIMGDHSKCGINTMFNTGTVVGVACNIYGSGFPRVFVPSFTWGGAAKFTTHKLEKTLETAELMMQRRSISLTNEDRQIMSHIFDAAATYRTWEKAVN